MKIFAYRIQPVRAESLSDVSDFIIGRDIGTRRFGGRGDIRLEDARTLNGRLYLDFSQRRFGHGPGRMADNAPITEVDLEDGEYFGEDTAVVVDIASGYAAVQYNHHGPKPIGLEEYMRLAARAFAGQGMQALDNFGFIWAAHLTPDGYRRLRGLGLIRKIEMTINVPELDQAATADGQSLGQVLNWITPNGTQTVTLAATATAERNSALGRDGVMGWVNDIERMGAALIRAKVIGKSEAGAPTEEIDLVEEQLKGDVQLRPARGERYVRQERWEALNNQLQQWRDTVLR